MSFYDAGTVDADGNPINFHYQLVQFTKNLTGEAYQEIDNNGSVVRFTDMQGNTIVVDVVEYYVADSNPPRPIWGT
jgi:hypothetical protein